MKNPVKVLIRFNTRNDNNNPSDWRVLIETCEYTQCTERYQTYFADNIILEVPSRTSKDKIAPEVVKWHISAYGIVEWVGKDCYVKASI